MTPSSRALAVLLALGLAACSSDSDSGTSPGPDSGVAPDTTDESDSANPPVDAGSEADTVEPLEFGELPAEVVPEGDEFIVVVLPDTQIYAQRYPETFDSQIQWIVDHAEEYRIVFVTHVGDIVQTASELDEWAVARAAYDWLDDIDMPHGFSVGGHDTSGNYTREFDNSCSTFADLDCEAREFIEHFGAATYAGRAWYGGASPSGRSSYQTIEVEGMQLLFLHLPQDVPEAEFEWANEVLDANPGSLVHLTTHRYLLDYRLTEVLPDPLPAIAAGRFSSLTYTLGGQGLKYETSISAPELFARLIRPRPNIWGVHCGHVDAEFWQQSENDAGLPVYEMLVDYQDMSDGGGGWLRILKFSPSENTVEAFTFSTTTSQIRQNGDGFEHSIDILDRYKDAYGDDLRAFGLNPDDLDALIDQVKQPGEFRDAYYESLYADGWRDSHFVLDVDFDAYINASR